MKREINLWFLRMFCIVTPIQIRKYGLKHHSNIYGDGINHWNCRSIWKDDKGRVYKSDVLLTNEMI